MTRLDKDTPFDNKLELWSRRIPGRTRDAAIYVNDTLELAYASAKQNFGDEVDPSIALAVYDRILDDILRRAKDDKGSERSERLPPE